MLGLPGGLARNFDMWGGVGLGWGCNHVSGSCTHAGCYATATLVCELSVFYVNMVRCWCVPVYTWYVAAVFMCTHGTLLVCSCGCMANRVKWIRCKLQVIVDFSARFGEKN